MDKTELINAYRRRYELETELTRIGWKIGDLRKGLTYEEMVEVLTAAIDDDKKLVIEIKRLHRKWEHKRKREGNWSAEEYTKLHHVYHLYHRNELVYVGITKDPVVRERQHKTSDKVFDRFEIISSHETRGQALLIEDKLIKEHRPKYNKQVF